LLCPELTQTPADVEATRFRWWRTLPLFAAVCAAGALAIFNYQKSSSPVVAAALYALRGHPAARAALGDEIYFARRIPWVRGEMNQLRGRIDIRLAVAGTRATATMRFASRRPTPRGVFETTEWSIETADGEKIDLLEGGDPFRGLASLGGGLDDDEDAVTPRGFRGR